MRCVFRRAQAARRKQKAAEEALAYRELARETCEGRPGFAALKLKHENEVTQLKMMGYNEAAALRKRATARFRSVPDLWVSGSGSGSGPGCGSFSQPIYRAQAVCCTSHCTRTSRRSIAATCPWATPRTSSTERWSG